MSKQKVVIGFPTGGKVDAIFTFSLINLQRYELENPSENYELVEILYSQGLYVENNRNEIVRSAKTFEADWLLMIDSDESFEPDLLRVIMRNANKESAPIIAGLYTNMGNVDKGGKFEVVDCIYGEAENGQYRVMSPPKELAPFDVDAAGTGVMLTHMSVYEKLEYPWYWLAIFEDPKDNKRQIMNEDIHFCRSARKAGYRILCDPMADVIHWKKVPLVPSTYARFQQSTREVFASMNKHLPINLAIDGFMSETELWWLYGQAKRFRSIVEIGCWKGRSTYALLAGCDKGRVYAVDHFEGSDNEIYSSHQEALAGKIYEEFMNNVGMFPNLTVFKCSSKDALAQFPTMFVEMVFVDGGHTYKEVKFDLEGWFQICSKFICGHDYDMSEVKRAVDEFAKEYKLEVKTGAGSIWYIEIA